MKKIPVFLLLILPLLFLYNTAWSAVLFSEDFESYTPGTFPGSGGWVIIHNGAGDAQQYIDNSQAASGSQSFHTMGSSCWAASLSNSLTVPERVRLEAKVYVDQLVTCGCTVLQAQVGLWRSDDSMWAGAVIFGCDGNIYASTQSGFPLVLLASYSVGTWYDVRIDYDYASKTFDVYIDGILIGHAIQILDDLTNKMPNAVRVGAGHGDYPVAWFDDIKMSEITCASPPPDMVSWWTADNTPLDIIDSNHGTLMNGATYADGKVYRAFSLDGIDDYVEIPDSATLDITGAFTIDGWFYIDPVASGNDNDVSALVAKTANAGAWALFFDDRNIYGYNNSISFLIFGTTGDGYIWAISHNIISTAGWYHITATFDPSSMPRSKIYVNAVNVADSGTGVINDVALNDYNLRIGASYLTDTYPGLGNDRFNGLIDEVEIFDRALTQTEIQDIYNAGAAGKCVPSCITPPSNMISWWSGDGHPFDLIDGNDGTLDESVTYADGKVGMAFSFDGGSSGSVVTPNVINNSPNGTIDMWVKFNNLLAGRALFGAYKMEVGEESQTYIFVDNGSNCGAGNSFCFIILTNSFNYFVNSDVTPVSGQWYHVAVTWGDDGMKIYVDGVLKNTNAGYTGPVLSDYYHSIGRAGWGTAIDGLIDEVEIFDRALTQTEIQDIYNAGAAGKCKPCDPTVIRHGLMVEF